MELFVLLIVAVFMSAFEVWMCTNIVHKDLEKQFKGAVVYYSNGDVMINEPKRFSVLSHFFATKNLIQIVIVGFMCAAATYVIHEIYEWFEGLFIPVRSFQYDKTEGIIIILYFVVAATSVLSSICMFKNRLEAEIIQAKSKKWQWDNSISS